MAYPLFTARLTSSGMVTDGPAHIELGYRLPVARRETPEGVFAEWSYDPQGQTLGASVDQHGFHPLYYHATAERVMVSPSTLALIAAGAPADLDERAVSLLLYNGFLFGEDTPFRHIRAMPAGGRLNWRPGDGASVTGRETIWKAQPVSRKQAVDGFVDLFRQAIARLLPLLAGQQAVLPLSGGRDSRHILLELLHQNAAPSCCVTYNYTRRGDDPESQSAARLAQAAGVRHRVLSSVSSPAAASIRAFGLTHCCSDEGFQSTPLRDHCRAAGVTTLLDGLAGDVLSRNRSVDRVQHRELINAGDWRGLARLMMAGHAGKSQGSVASLLTGDQRRRYTYEQAEQAFAERVAMYAEAADSYAAFIFYNRTRREIALSPYGLLSCVPRVICPFMDSDLVSFLGSLPVDVTFPAPLHDEVIATTYPRFADIPFGGGGSTGDTRSLARQARTLLAGMSAMVRIDPGGIGRELIAHIRLPFQGARRKLARYRYYLTLLERLGDGAIARRFLAYLDAMDRSPEP
jgi:hypothetical protein